MHTITTLMHCKNSVFTIVYKVICAKYVVIINYRMHVLYENFRFHIVYIQAKHEMKPIVRGGILL